MNIPKVLVADRRRRGFALIAVAGSAVAMLGALGLAVDLGRLYIVRNEAQAFTDSAALAAVIELDGTQNGFQRARNKVAANTNRWNMATQNFVDPVTEFAQAQTGPWEANPATGVNYRFLRVRAGADVSMYFVPVLGQPSTIHTGARAVAGQVPMTRLREGTFPFSPIAHNNTPPHFGLQIGQQYTLRWASNPKMNNVCEGDKVQSVIDKAKATGDERGYIEETSSSIIRQAIEGDYQTRPLAVGDIVDMTGGAKQTQLDSLINRVNQDTDSQATTYAQYVNNDAGNGRRVVLVPLNTWSPDYLVVGFAAFFLLHPSEYTKGGNQPFCAEYIGAYVQGASHGGAGQPGAYVARLLE
jgi:Flp pilus assembly protein TadG